MTKSSRSRRGNAIIEFALGATVLFPLFAGAFQFGYTFYVYNNLNTAIRGGARYASLRSYDSATSTPSTGFSTAVKNMVVYGNSAGTGQPVAPGLTVDNVQVSPVMSGAVPGAMTVQITGYTVDAVFTKFTFNAKPSATFPYTGTPAPF
jgi:Flp pilus assembly protein TadG